MGNASLGLDDWDEGIRKTITGIPTHVMLLSSQRDVVLQQRKLVKVQEELPEKLAEEMGDRMVSNLMELVVEELQNMSVQVNEQLGRIHGDKQG